MINYDTVLVAFISSIPATIAALGALITSVRGSRKTDEVQKSVNGRMTELLDISKKLAHIEGKEIGKAEAASSIIVPIVPTSVSVNVPKETREQLGKL